MGKEISACGGRYDVGRVHRINEPLPGILQPGLSTLWVTGEVRVHGKRVDPPASACQPSARNVFWRVPDLGRLVSWTVMSRS
jgi:hypothetical protein